MARPSCSRASRCAAGGRDLGAARPQRRRQDHAAGDDDGSHRAPRRHDPLRRPGASTALRAVSPGAARHRLCAAGARDLPVADGRGKSAGRGAAGARGRSTAVYDLFPSLAERRRNRGNQLSGGEQQMLAIGRALMGNPTLLLMDEPLEGLAPVIVDALLAGARPAEATRTIWRCCWSSSTRGSRSNSPTRRSCSTAAHRLQRPEPRADRRPRAARSTDGRYRPRRAVGRLGPLRVRRHFAGFSSFHGSLTLAIVETSTLASLPSTFSTLRI